MSRAQCWIDSDLLRQLRLAAEYEKPPIPASDGPGGVKYATMLKYAGAEALLEQIVIEWLRGKPYAALAERLDAARKAEEERFWAEQSAVDKT